MHQHEINRTAQATGDVEAVVNPEPPDRTPGGVQLHRVWITARMEQDGTLSVAISGSAKLGELTAGTQVDVTEAAVNSGISDVLRNLLDAHLDAIADDTMEAAYEARSIARRRARGLVPQPPQPTQPQES